MDFDQILKLVQIVIVDLVLAGDNAIVIGMVAARFTPDYRKKVILYGVGVAVVLRVAFALITVQLLAIKGLLIIGGGLLVWICWKLYKDLRNPPHDGDLDSTDPNARRNPPMRQAIFHIVIADLSMSLDNVLAVAGIADGHSDLLVIGLALSVLFMTFCASLIAAILQRFHWIGYVGLAILCNVAGMMLIKGFRQFM